MNHQIALSKKVFKIFVCATIGVLATPIRAAQVCDIPSAFEQETTTLTCSFDVDVNALKKDIAVLHYENKDPHNPETVLYSATFQGEIEYFTRPGFSIIDKVTNTLVIRIDRVTRGHFGRYECHILPSLAGDVQPCNLILKERVNDARDTSTPMNTTVTQNSPDISEEDEGIMQYVKPFIITTFCIVLLLLVIGGILIIAALYKRIKKKTDVLENGSDERMLTKNGSQSEHNHP